MARMDVINGALFAIFLRLLFANIIVGLSAAFAVGIAYAWKRREDVKRALVGVMPKSMPVAKEMEEKIQAALEYAARQGNELAEEIAKRIPTSLPKIPSPNVPVRQASRAPAS